MSDLRETIIGTIENAAQGTDLARSTWYDTRTKQETPVIDDTADRILAAVAEALTSETAVLHAAKAELATETENSWDSLSILFYKLGTQGERLDQARAGITAALRAAGIVKGEGDE